MSSQNDDRIERRLREIEAEINLQHVPRPVQSPPNRFQLSQTKLIKAAKIAAFAATGFIGVWVFSTVTVYISIVVGLAIAAGVGYFGYKLFFNNRDD